MIERAVPGVRPCAYGACDAEIRADQGVGMDVLVVGDANPDLILRGDVRPRFGQEEQLLTGADLVLGGSAAITACGLARLGLDTTLPPAGGAGVFGTVTRNFLPARGVPLAPPAMGLPTALSVPLAATGDRSRLAPPGALP